MTSKDDDQTKPEPAKSDAAADDPAETQNTAPASPASAPFDKPPVSAWKRGWGSKWGHIQRGAAGAERPK